MNNPILIKAGLFSIVITLLVVWHSPTQAQVDRYGGWMDVEATARGYFYLTEINGRNTFITPEGHAYYVMGINHLSNCVNEQYSHISEFLTDNCVL